MAEQTSVPFESGTSNPKPMPPVDLIPGYELLAWLGSGGMGDVYRARQLSLDRIVAIKIQRTHPASLFADLEPMGSLAARGSTVTDSDRLMREARLMAEVRHPNIVTVFDRGSVSGHAYTVMELVEGRNLRAVLPYRKPVELALVRGVMSELVSALEHLHKAGIVHRDLKPENVLLDGEGHVRLTDFGIALAIDRDGTWPHTDRILGTPDYMSPEQRIGFDVDARTDQYSLAVLAYEMLTGRVPVGAFRPPSQENPRLDPAIDRVLARALEAEPEDRYPSVTVFGKAFDLALPERRHRHRRIVVATFGSLVLALGVGIAWVGLTRGQPQAMVLPHEVQPPHVPPATVKAPQVIAPDPVPGKATEPTQGATDDALIAELSAEIGRNPKEVTHYYRRAQRYQALQQFVPMLDDLNEAARLAPNNAAIFLLRANARSSLNDPAGAIADASKSLELDPNQPLVYVARGGLQSELNHHDLALADFERAIQLAPNEAVSYVYRASTRTKMGDHRGAFDDLRRALELKPEDPEIHAKAATFLLDLPAGGLRNDALALQLASQARDLSGGRSWLALATLGRAYTANGSWDLALQEYRRALAIAPVSQRPLLEKLIFELQRKTTGETKP